MNKYSPWRLVAIVILATSLLLDPLGPVGLFSMRCPGGLSIEKEKQLGEQFLLEIQQEVPLIQDPFLTSYMNHLGQRLVAQMGSQPFHYRFFIVDDPTMNAFAVPGGYIFIHTGMIRMADREGELAGVMAHEISHVYCRHMSKMMEKSQRCHCRQFDRGPGVDFSGGVHGGAPVDGFHGRRGKRHAEIQPGLIEAQADSTGFKWMIKAGYNPRDMVTIFSKMNKQRWLEGGKMPVYLATHPDVDNRIVELSHQLTIHLKELPPERNNPDFEYFTIKLAALTRQPESTLAADDPGWFAGAE